MADNKQPPIPQPHVREPFLDSSGRLTGEWANWFMLVWLRIGESIALTNVQLEDLQQEELEEITAAIDEIESDILVIQSVNTTQNNRLNTLEEQVRGILLEPVA